MQFDRSTDHPRSRSVGVFSDYAASMNRLYVAGRRRALKLKRAACAPDHEQEAEQCWDAEGGGLKG
jgi:hypothetical protein